tara:strand:+ start:184 stop:660 length:477 start_codon:yes stop_codon:yes gene_type:complete
MLLGSATVSTAQHRSGEHQSANSLEAALQAAIHDPTAQRAFEAIFLESKVFMRITEESRAALAGAQQPDGRLGAEVPIKLWAVKDADTGTPTVPLFTSAEVLAEIYPDAPFVSVNGRVALSLTSGGLNYRLSDGGRHRVTWTAAEIATLLSRNPKAAP